MPENNGASLRILILLLTFVNLWRRNNVLVLDKSRKKLIKTNVYRNSFKKAGTVKGRFIEEEDEVFQEQKQKVSFSIFISFRHLNERKAVFIHKLIIILSTEPLTRLWTWRNNNILDVFYTITHTQISINASMQKSPPPVHRGSYSRTSSNSWWLSLTHRSGLTYTKLIT